MFPLRAMVLPQSRIIGLGAPQVAYIAARGAMAWLTRLVEVVVGGVGDVGLGADVAGIAAARGRDTAGGVHALGERELREGAGAGGVLLGQQQPGNRRGRV